MNAISLRRAIHSDAAALGSLHVASWRETYADILPDEILAELSVENRIEMWSSTLRDPDALKNIPIFVAEDGGRIIGFGACGRQRDEALSKAGFGGEFGAIYIFRSHQNRGLGRSIMAAMSRALSDLGHEAASLWVLRENSQARTFYEALGGEIIDEKVDEQAGATLIEVAYGWRNLRQLIR